MAIEQTKNSANPDLYFKSTCCNETITTLVILTILSVATMVLGKMIQEKKLLNCTFLSLNKLTVEQGRNIFIGAMMLSAFSLFTLSKELCKQKKEPPPSFASYPSLKSLEEYIPSSSVLGKAIFVDITCGGKTSAISTLKEHNSSKLEKNLDSNGKKCHFGVACFVNFAIAAATNSDRIILLDYDPIVVKFNKLAREILIQSNNRQEFKENLKRAVQADPQLIVQDFYPLSDELENSEQNRDQFSSTLEISSSFLSNDEDYGKVKSLAQNGEIHILQGSIYDQHFIEKIVQVTQSEGYQFSSLFISNVYDWDKNSQKRELLQQNIRTLSNRDNPMIVEVLPARATQDGRVNNVYYQDPDSHRVYDPKVLRQKGSEELQSYYPKAPLV